MKIADLELSAQALKDELAIRRAIGSRYLGVEQDEVGGWWVPVAKSAGRDALVVWLAGKTAAAALARVKAYVLEQHASEARRAA